MNYSTKTNKPHYNLLWACHSQWQLSLQRALFYKLWSSDGSPNSCRPRGNGVPSQCRQAARKTLIKGKWHAESLLKLLLLLLRSE